MGTVPDMPTQNLPPQVRAATLVPSTFNEAENTVEVIWTTGSRRLAWDNYKGEYYEEELVVEADAVDMTRFDSGVVQVLNNHRFDGGVESILGVALRGWVEGNEGKALLRLSVNPDNAGVVADIKSGVIRSISFGYLVQRYEVTEARARTDGGALALYRAISWTPQEISFVTIPADPNAQTRSQTHADQAADTPSGHRPAAAGVPCEFVTRASAQNTTEPLMPQATTDTPGGNPTPDPIRQQTPNPAPTAPAPASPTPDPMLARSADIVALCVRHGVADQAEVYIREGLTAEQAGLRILNEQATRDQAGGGHRNVRIQTVTDEGQTRMAGMEEALLHRVDSRTNLTDNGRQFRGMSMLEIGRDMPESAGVRTRGLDRMSLATRILTFRSSGGMHSTSDFSAVVANVANKRLRNAYTENEGTYTRWARRAPNAPDFKNLSVVQLSAMPDLMKVNEAGEFAYGALKDGAETYAVLTYGRIVSLTRQAIVNDDLRAFDRLVAGFGSSAARLENRLVYSQLTANANMGDGVALFEAATHKNLATGGGSALSLAALSAGRTAMRMQRGLQNELLNLAPAYLLAPAALEQTAYQLTSANYVAAKPGDTNEFRSGGRTSLDPIIEPLLDEASTTAWYLGASNGAVDTVEFCWLDGSEGPVIESEMGFEVDGIQLKCREDFAAKAIDHRGLYKATGT